MTPKPQYVEVAEVLGWTGCQWAETVGAYGHNPERKFGMDGYGMEPVPRFDTDWAFSGPVIERLEIDITKHHTGKWEATAWLPLWFRGSWKNPECVTGIGVTPLLAFCDLMLRLKRDPEVLQEVLKRLHPQA